jgi:hypothetical protein
MQKFLSLSIGLLSLFVGSSVRAFTIQPDRLPQPNLLAQVPEVQELRVNPNTTTVGEVLIAPGTGVTLNFVGVNQLVETVLIDNRSFVSLSNNGCLTGIQAQCVRNQASLLHVTLTDNFNVPGYSLVNRINSALLTIETIDPEKRHHQYLFRVRRVDNYSAKVGMINLVAD